METVTVHWHGPYRLDTMHQYTVSDSFGVYTISSIYRGKERLVYIGKTERPFSTRIKEHQAWIQLVHGEIRVRLGLLSMEDGRRYSSRKLSDVEALLITYYSPEENTVNSTWYYGRPELAIINTGRKGLLESRVSTEQLE